jgi:hypothetical protein
MVALNLVNFSSRWSELCYWLKAKHNWGVQVLKLGENPIHMTSHIVLLTIEHQRELRVLSSNTTLPGHYQKAYDER